jgi:ubiquinone/menaquinone biosynthesis C-methylase UbiE
VSDYTKTWDTVWQNTSDLTKYSSIHGRWNRALDKVGYFIQNEVQFSPGSRVLEAGCGNGAVTLTLASLFNIEGHGVDISRNAHGQAQALMNNSGEKFQFELGDVRSLPYDNDYFDVIISLGVIEHMHDYDLALREMFRTLKGGGRAIIMTPNKLSFGVLDRKIKQVVRQWPFGYQTEFTPVTLGKLANQVGFDVDQATVSLRRVLRTDSKALRAVSVLDQVFNCVIKDWGFYSYVFATKPDKQV